ncbi:MAG: hypothetical protein HQL24_08730 [Candidatus Omnitrophica bacterium]|nr:hypothetical protein [Candidatus Omnitrophota bacterium]
MRLDPYLYLSGVKADVTLITCPGGGNIDATGTWPKPNAGLRINAAVKNEQISLWQDLMNEELILLAVNIFKLLFFSLHKIPRPLVQKQDAGNRALPPWLKK